MRGGSLLVQHGVDALATEGFEGLRQRSNSARQDITRFAG